MSMNYGTIDRHGKHRDVGHSLHGAKVSATHYGRNVVSVRSPLGYNIDVVARKVSGKWINS